MEAGQGCKTSEKKCIKLVKMRGIEKSNLSIM